MRDEHPILFTPESIEAILAGRKHATRRVFGGKYGFHLGTATDGRLIIDHGDRFEFIRSPYGTTGDLLWVREPYQRNGKTVGALFMPKRRARLWLWISKVTVSTLGDMTTLDAIEEGCHDLDEYRQIWNEINGKRGFPWKKKQPVWEIHFIIHERKDTWTNRS